MQALHSFVAYFDFHKLTDISTFALQLQKSTSEHLCHISTTKGLNKLQVDDGGGGEGGVPLPPLHEGHGGCCPAEGKLFEFYIVFW